VHLLLTDRLTCPRCGPGFGLILLADRLVERRVLAGALGCSNCRDRFPIEDGFADLRPPPRAPLGASQTLPEPTADATERLAALLGVAQGPGNVGLIGAVAAHAGPLAELIQEIEVVAVDAGMRGVPEREGVSRLVMGPLLPFQWSTFRAAAVAGESAELDQVLPALARGGRLVLADPAPDARTRLERAGARIMVSQPDWIVALKETG
jgi:uncharacterized protein YbaR (Trm112 family)